LTMKIGSLYLNNIRRIEIVSFKVILGYSSNTSVLIKYNNI